MVSLNPETAMQPRTQSVRLHDDLFITIQPLSGGDINKVFFEKQKEGEEAQQVPIPDGYNLVYSNSQEAVGRMGDAWIKP